MKYFGFEIPDENSDGYDWIYDLIEDRGYRKGFIINADSPEEARRIYFKELYKDFKHLDQLAYSGICHLDGSYEDDEIVEMFGKSDGKIINEILNELCNLTEKEIENLPETDLRTKQLSAETIYELCYGLFECSLGILKIEKELK